MLTTFVLTAVGLYAAACAGVFLVQHRLVYFPTREIVATPAAAGLAFEDRWLDTEDGVRLHAWWVPGPPQAPTVLFLHGNAGNVSDRIETLQMLAGLGLGVLIVDYRGYGLSGGEPSEHGTYLDARAAYAHLTGALGVAPGRVVVFGRSLGGGIATWIAAEHPCAALVVESSFTSVPDLAAGIYPLLPVRLLSRIRYDSQARIGRARCPVLVVHSRDDEVVPFAHGERLFRAASEPKQFLEIRGGHNDGFVVSGAEYVRGIGAFLARAR